MSKNKFHCGHSKLDNPILQDRIYFSKKEQKLKTCTIKICRKCHNKQSAAWLKKNRVYKCNRRWKLNKKGKRVFYEVKIKPFTYESSIFVV